MITTENLLELLVDIESARVERTISINDTNKFSQAVCAFANDMSGSRESGYLVIGVDDKGNPSGLTVTDKLLQNLAALRSDGNILPLPALTVEKTSLPDGDIAVVEVLPSDMPPVRYKGQIWIRIGPRKAIASEQEERILIEKRIACSRSFDSCPMQGTNTNDVSVYMFHEYRGQSIAKDVIDANNRSLEEQLASLRFFDSTKNCVTTAGILLFGINPQFYLPGAYVQFLRFPGTTITDLPIDQMEISGTLPNVADLLREKFRSHIRTMIKDNINFRDIVAPDYPELAIRELFHNAIMHRDYQSFTPIRFYWFEDRIEIQNPGGLYGEVTKETLTKRNSYRNPVIAEALKELGYVNRFGYGIQRAQEELNKNGNPSPEFEIDAKTFLVTIRRRQ